METLFIMAWRPTVGRRSRQRQRYTRLGVPGIVNEEPLVYQNVFPLLHRVAGPTNLQTFDHRGLAQAEIQSQVVLGVETAAAHDFVADLHHAQAYREQALECRSSQADGKRATAAQLRGTDAAAEVGARAGILSDAYEGQRPHAFCSRAA
jgi:hypothetical protein